VIEQEKRRIGAPCRSIAILQLDAVHGKRPPCRHQRNPSPNAGKDRRGGVPDKISKSLSGMIRSSLEGHFPPFAGARGRARGSVASGLTDAPEIETARRLLLAQRSLSLLVPLVFDAAERPEEAAALRGSGRSFARLRGPLREAAEYAATNPLVAAVIDCAQTLVACADDGQPARQAQLPFRAAQLAVSVIQCNDGAGAPAAARRPSAHAAAGIPRGRGHYTKVL